MGLAGGVCTTVGRRTARVATELVGRVLLRGCSQIAMSRLTGKCRHEGTEHSHWQKPKMHTFNAAQL
jgi:hypothetical protein